MRTGQILDNSPDPMSKFELKNAFCDRIIAIDRGEMTAEQRREMRVDMDDTISPLGRKLSARRNQPCPCGSGRKFKKCCL